MNSKKGLILVRKAAASDAEGIVRIIRSGREDWISDATIFGCPGAEDFVRDRIAMPEALSDTEYLVAESGGALAGCIEMRRTTDALFLNDISVLPEYRSCGAGSRLLKGALELIGHKGCSRMELDVFEDNATAKAWYERMGFIRVGEKVWWDLGSLGDDKSGIMQIDRKDVCQAGNSDARQSAGILLEYPQARIVHRAYGFSQFALATRTGLYRVGRLNEKWFRITDPALLYDREAIAALRQLDGSRRILAIADWETTDGFPSDMPFRHKSSLRMSAPLDQVERHVRQAAEAGETRGAGKALQENRIAEKLRYSPRKIETGICVGIGGEGLF